MILDALRRHTQAAVLVVLAVAVSVYVLVIDRGSLTTDETEARKNRILPAWRIDDVTKIQVTLATPEGLSQAYTLSRGPKDDANRSWNLELQEAVLPAEEQVVFKLMSAFEYAKALRTIGKDSVDRAAFGLDAPRSKFAITMGDLSFKIAVGALSPSQEGHYVEVEGRGVYVVPKSSVRAMEISADELRSRAFVPYLSTQLGGLVLEGEGGVRKFERASWYGGRGSGFKFGEGSEGLVGKRVDGSRLDQVFVAFGHMQAETFLDPKAAEAASKPRVTITMVPKDGGTSGVLAVGGECPGKPELIVVLRKAPTFVGACVPKSILAPLVRPASDFVDDGMVGAAVDEITELTIERGDKVLEMARFGTGFHVRKPQEAQIGNEVGNHLLTDIVEARGDIAPDDAKMPEGPTTKLKIVSQAGAAIAGKIPERIEEVEIGPLVDGKHLVVRKEDGGKLWVGESAAASLQPSDLLLRDTTVLDEKPMSVVEMTIKRGGTEQTFTQNGADIALVSPKGDGVVADRGFVASAVAMFVKLEAVRWVAEQEEPSFGLAEPRFAITVKLSDPDGGSQRTLELDVGAVTDDGAYAKLTGTRGVFLLPRSFEDTYDRLLVSREAFTLDPGTADRIEVRAGETTATLARDGRQMRWAGKKDARAAQLIKEIADLSPLRAVAVGAPAKRFGFDTPALQITLTPRKNPNDSDGPKAITIVIGAGDAIQGVPVRYARRSDVDATYALPLSNVRRIEDLVAGEPPGR